MIKSNLKRTLSWPLISTLALAAPALADSETGWFLESNAYKADVSGEVSGFTLDDDDGAWALGGGYRFNRYFSVQAAWHDLGSHYATDCPPPVLCLVANTDRVSLDGVSASVTGAWPVGEQFEVFGKLGAMRWDADFQRFPARDTDATDLLYGAGVGWWITPNWRLAAQYEKVEDLDLEVYGLGLIANF